MMTQLVSISSDPSSRRRGWGLIDQEDRACCNCSNCAASCVSFHFWYAPYDSDTNFIAGAHKPVTEGWGWDTQTAVVDGIPMRFRYDHSRTAPTVHVYGGVDSSTPIGKTVRRLFGPCDEDNTWITAYDAEGAVVFRLLRPPGDRCWRCLTCCGNMELDSDVVRGGGEAAPQEVVATLTTRVHACRPCYPRWFGVPVWPEGATENEKALLMGLAHALTPGPLTGKRPNRRGAPVHHDMR